MRKVFVVGEAKGYGAWMYPRKKTNFVTIVHDINQADLIVFTGGEDVDPAIYGEQRHYETMSNIRRDIRETAIYRRAIEQDIPMVGICRGAQLLCALNGGILVQHQPNPRSNHYMYTYDKEYIDITSSHHQAAFPFNLPKDEYKVLAWTAELDFHLGGSGEELNPPMECEVVYYPKTRCLGIQGHPERMNFRCETVYYLQELIDELLDNNLEKKINEYETKEKKDYYYL